MRATWLLVLLLVAGPLQAEDARRQIEAILETTEDDLDYGAWGIRQGCIIHTRIRQVNFVSNDAGILELTGGQKVLVTLRNNCSGIRNEGYVHKPVNGRFCEGDILRVIRYGTVCVVDRIRPYVVATDE